jgi:hypothetical protein
MRSRRGRQLVWHRLHWQRPITPEMVSELVRLWANDPRAPRIILELRRDVRALRWLLGTDRDAVRQVTRTLRDTVSGTVATEDPDDLDRPPVEAVGSLRIHGSQLALGSDNPQMLVRGLLRAMARVRGDEYLVLQIMLGARLVPLIGPEVADAPWWWPLRHEAKRLETQRRTSQRLKVSEPGFRCVVRLGVSASTVKRRRGLLAGVLAAVRVTQASGTRLWLKPVPPRRLNLIRSPWWWPLKLNASELTGLLGWPLGDDSLPGVAELHPVQLPPLADAPSLPERVVGLATAPGYHGRPIGMKLAATLQHSWLIGPTGSGKSTLLTNVVCQDIARGLGVVLIEPKGDLVEAVLQRIPDWRQRDVVVLDPADAVPVGLNPLSGAGSPEVRSEGLVAVFRALWADSWGPRTQDILQACLLTLTRHGDASLPMVPLLLTNHGFRRSVTQRVAAADPLGLGTFWGWYDRLSDGERASVIAPVMNKLRAFLLSPRLRGIIGQREPRISLSQLLHERKILLVPLRTASIGAGSAQLLGSLVMAGTWQAIKARQGSRAPVSVVIDEAQDYLHLPPDIADALATARGMGAGFTLAHQYLAQLPITMRAALLGNVRSRVVFQLAHDDATVLSRGHPEINAEDITALGAFEVYASLLHGNRTTPYVSARTVPEPPAVSDAAAVRRLSREQFGRDLASIEAELLQVAESQQPAAADDAGGRRRRQP